MKKAGRTLLVAVAVVMVTTAATACSDSGASGPSLSGGTIDAEGIPAFAKNSKGYADIQVADLSEMMQDKSFAFVNVHVPYQGEIPGTDAFVEYDRVSELLDAFPAQKDAPIVVYCRSGRMSDEAAAVLADAGYSNVMELDGGFSAWSAAGLPFVSDGAPR